MPTYNYCCDKCGKQLSKESSKELDMMCITCNISMRTGFFIPNFHIKVSPYTSDSETAALTKKLLATDLDERAARIDGLDQRSEKDL